MPAGLERWFHLLCQLGIFVSHAGRSTASAGGFASRRGLVVGGAEEPAGPHPFVVSLQYRNRHFCGGTLLDSQHVLTAAHCEKHVRCTGEICEGVEVNVFRHNVSILAEDEFPGCSQVIRGDRWVSHPSYTGAPLHTHDIAVLGLERRVPQRYACVRYGLASTASFQVTTQFEWPGLQHPLSGGSRLQAVGWGRLWDHGPLSPVLMETTVDAIMHSECNRAWRQLQASQVCAYSGDTRTRDVCNGDSGGPLLVPGTNMQIGIASFSHKCGDPQFPAVFTMVGAHQAWIDQTIQCLRSRTCCPYPEFSDGILSSAEMCDDGNDVAGDGCFCGQIEMPYSCDAGSLGMGPSICTRCQIPAGDRLVAASDDCVDLAQRGCARQAGLGQCQSNSAYMAAYCRATCDIGGCRTGVDPSSGLSPAVYVTMHLDAGQTLDDYSWKVWQRDDVSVRNVGTGDGYVLCTQPGQLYDLQVKNNRWNTSAGFSLQSGPSLGRSSSPRPQVILNQGWWTGRSISLSFSQEGRVDSDAETIDFDSCITISFFQGGTVPLSIPNSYATFGPAEFDIDETEFEFTDPPNACGDALINGDDLSGKIAIVDRGDCFFAHKANVVQAAGAIALIVVNSASNPAETISMSGGTDDTVSIENSCCVSIPLAMISSGSAQLLRDRTVSQVAMSASDCYATRVACPAPGPGQSVPASCSGCSAGHTEDCNNVCRDSTRLGDGYCDIGNDVSGSTDFACAAHFFDLGDCRRDNCVDNNRWRDPLGRGCADGAYQAVPGACGDYEDSFIACPQTCGTCEGACNALWDTKIDRSGVSGSCASLTKQFGIPCEELEAAGSDCRHARFCGYCNMPPQACARGWQLDCDDRCAPLSWVGDGICDNGGSTAFNFNCQQTWWDDGDCQVHRLPAGCAKTPDTPAVAEFSGARGAVRTLSLRGGYGQNWHCRWQISCRADVAHLRFLSFDLENHFDKLEVFVGTAAADIVSVPCDSTCREQRGCSSLSDADGSATCQRRAQIGHCQITSLRQSCLYTCSDCVVPVVSSVTTPTAVLTGTTVPDAIDSRQGLISLRFDSDDFVSADGFALQYWCGSSPPPPAAALPRKTCARENPCVRGVCIEAYGGSSQSSLACRCPFGWEGQLCAIYGLTEPVQTSCREQLVDIAESLTAACCGNRESICNGGVPERCDGDCAVVWMPFWKECSKYVDNNFRQFLGFSAECERTQFGEIGTSSSARCSQQYWATGLQAVVAACCNGDECSADGTYMPKTCQSDQCEAAIEELVTACHVSTMFNRRGVASSLTALQRACQNRHR
eukprot:SAG22_NODE_341_length_11992_cov_180.308753_6_plen_1303_part_00